MLHLLSIIMHTKGKPSGMDGFKTDNQSEETLSKCDPYSLTVVRKSELC
ncbi:MAG: hypothetical protein K0Q73_3805 [Paenibacillus sp.]|jgi:hypothetical protein|nr:hypothetical protein [Paenibacillus sp.]